MHQAGYRKSFHFAIHIPSTNHKRYIRKKIAEIIFINTPTKLFPIYFDDGNRNIYTTCIDRVNSIATNLLMTHSITV